MFDLNAIIHHFALWTLSKCATVLAKFKNNQSASWLSEQKLETQMIRIKDSWMVYERTGKLRDLTLDCEKIE